MNVNYSYAYCSKALGWRVYNVSMSLSRYKIVLGNGMHYRNSIFSKVRGILSSAVERNNRSWIN